MDKETTFIYRYSAPENKELQDIRKKYLPIQESGFDELRRLDRDVQRAGLGESLTVGVSGCLVFGLGLCLAMRVIGGGLLLGVLADIAGAAAMLAAYPVYRRISNKTRERLVPRILQLTEELSGQKNPAI